MACVDCRRHLRGRQRVVCRDARHALRRLSSGAGSPSSPAATRTSPSTQGLDATRADGRQRRVRNDSLDFGRVYDNIFSLAGDYVVIEVADVTDEVREHDRRQQIQSARDVIWERVVEYSVIVDLVDRQIFASPAVWQDGRSSSSRRPSTTARSRRLSTIPIAGRTSGWTRPPCSTAAWSARSPRCSPRARSSATRARSRCPGAESGTSTPSWCRGAWRTGSAASSSSPTTRRASCATRTSRRWPRG